MELLSMKRYEMPGPPAGRASDLTAWNDAVDNSEAQLEHQLNRITNLNLMTKYGPEAWKVYNTVLNQLLTSAKEQLQDIKKQIQEINWQRKSAQMTAGDKLRSLEANWVQLVSKNYEIERTCLQLEVEVSRLRDELQPTENGTSDSVTSTNDE